MGFVLAGLLLASSVAPAGATILLFDQARDSATQTIVAPTASGDRLPAGYGDNVTGAAMAVPGGVFTNGDGGEGFTPDVTVELFSASSTPTDPRMRLWISGYGDLVDVAWAEGPGIGGSSMLNVLFQAAPGFVVDLYGFDLAGWNHADYTIAGVEVLAGAMSLYAATDVLVEGNATGPGHTTFSFDAPLSGAELLLQLDLSNLTQSMQDNIGIDNIRFGQTPPRVVPEPTTATLLLCGLGLLGRRALGKPVTGRRTDHLRWHSRP